MNKKKKKLKECRKNRHPNASKTGRRIININGPM